MLAHMGEMGDMMGGMGGWMFLGAVLAALFWGSLIALAVWAIRRFTDRPSAGSAHTILEERFARGEIDAEELDRRTRVLEAR